MKLSIDDLEPYVQRIETNLLKITNKVLTIVRKMLDKQKRAEFIIMESSPVKFGRMYYRHILYIGIALIRFEVYVAPYPDYGYDIALAINISKNRSNFIAIIGPKPELFEELLNYLEKVEKEII